MKRSDDWCEAADGLRRCCDLNLSLFSHGEWIKHQYRHRDGLAERIGKWSQRVLGPDNDLVNVQTRSLSNCGKNRSLHFARKHLYRLSIFGICRRIEGSHENCVTLLGNHYVGFVIEQINEQHGRLIPLRMFAKRTCGSNHRTQDHVAKGQTRTGYRGIDLVDQSRTNRPDDAVDAAVDVRRHRDKVQWPVVVDTSEVPRCRKTDHIGKFVLIDQRQSDSS